jgi:hypothetical protein
LDLALPLLKRIARCHVDKTASTKVARYGASTRTVAEFGGFFRSARTLLMLPSPTLILSLEHHQ